MRYLIITLFLLAGACQKWRVAQEIANGIDCAWSEKYSICVCAYGNGQRGGIISAPPEACNHIVMPPVEVEGKVEEDIEL